MNMAKHLGLPIIVALLALFGLDVVSSHTAGWRSSDVRFLLCLFFLQTGNISGNFRQIATSSNHRTPK